jgi:hypothetical protein
MRPWIRWITKLAGLLIIGIGGLATWKVLAPGSEPMVGAVDGWMFEGPALITFGLLLLWTTGSTDAGRGALDRRGPRLLMQIGLGFVTLPAATWAWNEAAGTTASSYAWSFAAFALGVPGLALLLTGLALWLWRRLRSR